MSRMRCHSIALFAALALACGGEDGSPPSPTPVTPEPVQSAEPTKTSESAPQPTREGTTQTPIAPAPDLTIPRSPPLPVSSSDPTRAHVFVPFDPDDENSRADEDDLSEEDAGVEWSLFVPEGALLPVERVTVSMPTPRDANTEREVSYPRFRHPSARVTRMINERIRDYAHAQVRASADHVSCAGIATRTLASIGCAMGMVMSRSSFAIDVVGYGGLTLRIDGNEVRPMTIADAFVPGADLPALLRQGCEGFVQREEAEDENLDCRASPDIASRASFAAHGIRVETNGEPYGVIEYDSFLVPYDELASHLLARGPLAESLYRRRARTREIAIDPSRRAAAPPTRAVWAIGPMSSLAEAAMTWMRLPPASRDALRFVDGYLSAPSEQAATSAASTLGLRASEVRVDAAASPIALRAFSAARDTPLRLDARRTAPGSRMLPRGTLLVGAGDPIEGHTRVIASGDAIGFADARALGPSDACVPDPSAVIASLPEASRADAPYATMRVLTRQAGGARAIFITELGRTIHIEVHRMNDACALERTIARFDRPGVRLTYFGLTHTERRAGQALIVTAADEPAELAVHAYENGRSLFTRALAEGQSVGPGRSEGEAWYPIVILDAEGERAAALVWTAEGLAAPP